MGQSPNPSRKSRAMKSSAGSPKVRRPAIPILETPEGEALTLSVFETRLGWIGAIGRGPELVGLTVGHPSAMAARTAAVGQIDEWELGNLDAEFDWSPVLKKRLMDYAAGKRVKFDDIPLELPELTDFQARVINQTRKIGYGETLPYGELALRAGFPRAARGVGTVMAHNRFPVIIPCHRVVASQGKLGGYSGPQGVCLKEQLLALETGERH